VVLWPFLSCGFCQLNVFIHSFMVCGAVYVAKVYVAVFYDVGGTLTS